MENKMKKIESLRELQLVQIYIYKELLEFCNKNNLNIFLSAGTLLGAIRHKGFIPWDDDIDLCMSRNEYNKLIEISKYKISDKCSLIDPLNDSKYKGIVPVVVYNNSKIISKQFKEDENLKIGISIFVYDNIPNNKLKRKLFFQHMYILRAKHALCRANFKYVNTKIARIVGPLLSPFYSKKKVYKFKNKILKYQQKYNSIECKNISLNVDCYPWREVEEKNVFDNYQFVSFEKINSRIFSNYDELLKRYYDDYMKYPPIDKRTPKHNATAEIEENFLFNF